MARRSIRVGPDSLLETLDGRQIPVVSREAQYGALADFATMADVAGGTISALYGRVPTGVPGEMATSEVLLTWQDRGDAKPQYEEPVSFEPSEPEPVLAVAPDEAEPFVDGDGVVRHAEDAPAAA
jgi:hypothetical protein